MHDSTTPLRAHAPRLRAGCVPRGAQNENGVELARQDSCEETSDELNQTEHRYEKRTHSNAEESKCSCEVRIHLVTLLRD